MAEVQGSRELPKDTISQRDESNLSIRLCPNCFGSQRD